jgi:hypothetical protein
MPRYYCAYATCAFHQYYREIRRPGVTVTFVAGAHQCRIGVDGSQTAHVKNGCNEINAILPAPGFIGDCDFASSACLVRC